MNLTCLPRMNNRQTELLKQFIKDNQLQKPDGTIRFQAVVSFYKQSSIQHIGSEIQVLNLPKQMAVYVLEFLKEEYGHPEMYNTSQQLFSTRGRVLEIRDPEDDGLLISISPFD